MTWDRRMMVWMSPKQLNDMFHETCLLGPLAAMFGREFQQYLLENPGKLRIPKETMQYSVDSGRTSMGNKRMEMVHTQYVADEYDDDRASISSRRTRSPRRDAYRNIPWKQSPSNRQYSDIRDDPNYQAMKDSIISRALGEDSRIREQYPREGRHRDDKSQRGEHSRSQTGRLEPRYYEPRPKERKPHRHGYDSD